MYRLLTSLNVTLFVALYCAAAWAQTQDQPIHIEADHAEYSDKTGISTYTGKVMLTQGDLVLHGDKLTVTRNKKSGNIEAALVGKPATLTKAADTQNAEPVNGHSKRMEYDSTDAVVVLRGAAFVKRGGDTISGETIRHHLNTARTEAQRADNGERVKITIQPQTVDKSETATQPDTGANTDVPAESKTDSQTDPQTEATPQTDAPPEPDTQSDNNTPAAKQNP